MANVSVKLDEATHQRLKTIAARVGMAPHAFMVQAIGDELDRIEEQQRFIDRARQSLARVEAGAPVYDGPAYAAYLKERVRASLSGEKPTIKRPKPTTLAELKGTGKARA